MNTKWKKINKSHILKAIELFDNSTEKYPEPKNTFLIYNNKKYPAKHIRGLAYQIANDEEMAKSNFSGGLETVNFFKRLNFTVQYKKETIQKKLDKFNKSIDTIVLTKKKKYSKKLNPVDQKNALQLLLQKHFGLIETEKKFEWLKTPDHDVLPKEYLAITKNLIKYRNQKGFKKSNYKLLCDIVLEEYKLIIEYDENQHFSKARQISLENYPANIDLQYSKLEWINYCLKINAKDNNPIDRDEKRAFYDSVRDIETFKNGYKLLRIKHGEIDWTLENSIEMLKNIFEKYKINKSTAIVNHKIGRLILRNESDFNQLDDLLLRFINETIGKKHFEFLITPGGFLGFDIPKDLINYTIKELESERLDMVKKEAELTIIEYFHKLPKQIKLNLEKIVDYVTIGIDGFFEFEERHIELVAIYDLMKKKVIHWTGKFYPTESQKNDLIKIVDLNSHFIELNNQKVVILGCHDLNVFNPRGQANANPNGWKKQLADEFKNLCLKYKPQIILQHPHTTDTPNIWNLAWRTLDKELPMVEHYASGINYFNNEDEPRGTLEKVLEKTKKGDVVDFK